MVTFELRYIISELQCPRIHVGDDILLTRNGFGHRLNFGEFSRQIKICHENVDSLPLTWIIPEKETFCVS